MATDLIFDFFGTLVQYTPGPFHTAPYERTHEFLLRHGYALSYDAFTTAFASASDEVERQARATHREYHMHDLGRRFFAIAFGTDGPDSVVAPFISVFMEEWCRGIVHYDGIDTLLRSLGTTYRLSVLSNTHYPSVIHDNLAAMGVAHHFDRVFTSVEIGIRKPHPAIFEHSLAQLGIGADQAIYVGDTYADDYQGATSARIKCVLIAPPGKHEDVPDRVASLFELPSYLERTTHRIW